MTVRHQGNQFTPLSRVVGYGVVIGTLNRCKRGTADEGLIDQAIEITNALASEAIASMDESDG